MSVRLAHEGVVAAWYAFADVIISARALQDWLSRRANRRVLRDQGLIPALRPARLKKRVVALFAGLIAGPPVRDFIPVLVEQGTRRWLAREGRGRHRA